MATITLTGTRDGAVAATHPGASLQRAGGIAALLEGLGIIGSIVLIEVVEPALGMKGSYWQDPSKAVAAIAAHVAFFGAVAVFGTLTGLIVLPVVASLHERLRVYSPGLINTATILGAFGAIMGALNQLAVAGLCDVIGGFPRAFAEQAMPGAQVAWDAALGGAGLGLGVWALLVSWVVIRKGGLPRWLGYFGILVGITDLLALTGAPFGVVVSIPWFIGAGIALLRAPRAMVQGEL